MVCNDSRKGSNSTVGRVASAGSSAQAVLLEGHDTPCSGTNLVGIESAMELTIIRLRCGYGRLVFLAMA